LIKAGAVCYGIPAIISLLTMGFSGGFSMSMDHSDQEGKQLHILKNFSIDFIENSLVRVKN